MLTNPLSAVCRAEVEQKEQTAYSCQAGRRVRLMRGMSGECGESLVYIMNSQLIGAEAQDDGVHLETKLFMERER